MYLWITGPVFLTGGETGTRESFDLFPPVKSEEYTCSQAAETRRTPGRKEGRHVRHLYVDPRRTVMEMLHSKWKKVTFPVTRKRESSHMCARQTRMLSNQRLPPLQPGVYGVAKPRNRAEQTEISLPSRLCASVGVGWITPPYSKYIKTHMWRLRLPSGAAVQWLKAAAPVLEGEEHQRR